ncbi:MAG TPA: RagB/SusD family nutrient uptake outer membrane protein [Xanthomarina gelatinilytica]|uniref:RagB/SusD family nutrient uptake outer membrane protein n=1 Tax=Xanthomarina gelatinilytica TaxID=1137281 RepID=A0A3D6BNW5_9FLAO|nr:RagB/SusD family nutrient uptake outer membrane protein [Xanthomarina gelatinilytica]
MKTKQKRITGTQYIFQLIIVLLLLGCEDYLEVESPKSQIDQETVFLDEGYATAAVTSLYASLRDNVLLTGSSNGMSILYGLYTDELDYYSNSGSDFEEFYNHQIIASNGLVLNQWSSSYNLIFNCNSVIEGISSSPSLSQEVKNQLKGEALFIRALTHFYLVNLFGDIPYITTTDYTVNQQVSRMETEIVYDYILNDLILGKTLLGEADLTGERIRANKYVVSALLARVYLYLENWEAAETESSSIINASSLYYFEGDVANEFLNNSQATILQLKPKNEGDNTLEAGTFIFSSGPPVLVALNSEFTETFETDDLRREHWVLEVTDGSEIWYAPYKYKLQENTGASMEYSIIFRLAEQYLIRAEARAPLGNILASAEDINVIRNRAGLSNTTASTTTELMAVILHERQVELFTEHGHRWFDLKRLNKAGEVLAPIKSNWQITDILMPIPETELLLNPNLTPQNNGY